MKENLTGACAALRSIAAIASAALLPGCASILSGTKQTLSVDAVTNSGAPVIGARCKLVNGDGTWYITTPGSSTVDRAFSDMVVTCERKDLPDATASVKSKTKAIAFGNILIGGIVGAGVDIANGAAYEYPSPITVRFNDIAPHQERPALSKVEASLQPHTPQQVLATSSVLESSGCAPASAPIKFRETARGSYYETRCEDGRLFHSICKDETCWLRTSADR